jgi:hypothetical protein
LAPPWPTESTPPTLSERGFSGDPLSVFFVCPANVAK